MRQHVGLVFSKSGLDCCKIPSGIARQVVPPHCPRGLCGRFAWRCPSTACNSLSAGPACTAEVNLQTEHCEFSDWRWMPLEELPASVIDFKRGVYQQVADEFAPRIKGLVQEHGDQ